MGLEELVRENKTKLKRLQDMIIHKSCCGKRSHIAFLSCIGHFHTGDISVQADILRRHEDGFKVAYFKKRDGHVEK